MARASVGLTVRCRVPIRRAPLDRRGPGGRDSTGKPEDAKGKGQRTEYRAPRQEQPDPSIVTLPSEPSPVVFSLCPLSFALCPLSFVFCLLFPSSLSQPKPPPQ